MVSKGLNYSHYVHMFKWQGPYAHDKHILSAIRKLSESIFHLSHIREKCTIFITFLVTHLIPCMVHCYLYASIHVH